MADNVLGVLFQDIANAIRAKTGGAGTMKPAEFPAEIASIVTGGGSASGEIKYASGNFSTTEAIKTVSYAPGFAPDIMIVSLDDVPGNGELLFAIGFSRAMLSAMGGGFKSFAKIVSVSGTASMGSDVGMEASDPANGNTYGFIRGVTSTQFTVGGSIGKLNTTGFVDPYENPYGQYSWLAIGGIMG